MINRSRQEDEWTAADKERSAVGNLVDAARGTCLILDSIAEEFDGVPQSAVTILMGLASSLQIVVDQVDAVCFDSPGALSRTLSPRQMRRLLEHELEKTRAGEQKTEVQS